jgi:hypothetical protein
MCSSLRKPFKVGISHSLILLSKSVLQPNLGLAHWQLTSGGFRSWKLGVGSWELGVGSWELVARAARTPLRLERGEGRGEVSNFFMLPISDSRFAISDSRFNDLTI